MEQLRQFNRDERAQDLIEYTLIALLVALGCIFGLGTLASSINAELAKIAGKLT